MTRRALPVVATLVALVASGCGGGAEEPATDPDRVVLVPAEDGESHTHAPGQGHDSEPLGDGSTSTAGGYRLTDVRVPRDGTGPGDFSFRILDRTGEPVTDYTEEQTKLLHMYVVRDDLAVFRHLHPVQDDDGTWRVRADLGSAGDYRVLTEFVPTDSGRTVALGADATVPGEPGTFGSDSTGTDSTGDDAGTGDDGVVRARVDGTGEVSDDGRLQVLISDLDGAPLQLGSYLGTSAHLTGFRLGGKAPADQGFVHVHPYGAPEQTDDGTLLTFHTTFSQAGSYRFFVQTRVEGFLHTVPLVVEVA